MTTTPPPPPTRTDPRPAFFAAARLACDTVADVSPAQLADPTPCTEFDVRALLGHLVAVLRRVASVAAGTPAIGQVPLVTDVPDDGWGAAVRAAVGDVRPPGPTRRCWTARCSCRSAGCPERPPWRPGPASSARTRGTWRSRPASPPPGTNRCSPAPSPRSASSCPRPSGRRGSPSGTPSRSPTTPRSSTGWSLAGSRPAVAPGGLSPRREVASQLSCGATSEATRSRWSRSARSSTCR